MVCAIRNPDATVPEVAATTGVADDEALKVLRDAAVETAPLSDPSGKMRALLDTLDARDTRPAQVDEDKYGTLASVAGRQAGAPMNEQYVESLLTNPEIEVEFDARRLDRIIDGGANLAALAGFINDVGLRRFVRILGYDPPDENLDELEAPAPDPDDMEYQVLLDHADDDDVEPGERYFARVNTRPEPWGMFVSLTDGHPDVSGLIHESRFPSMVGPDDFVEGDEVVVRLVRIRENGDLGFELAGIVDAVRLAPTEFRDRDEFLDERDSGDDREHQVRPRGRATETTSTPRTRSPTGEGGAERAQAAVDHHGYFEGGEGPFCEHCDGGPYDGKFGLSGHLSWCDVYNEGDPPSREARVKLNEGHVLVPGEDSAAHAIMEAVAAAGGRHTRQGLLADLPGRSTSTVDGASHKLVKTDYLERLDQGVVGLTEKGRDFAPPEEAPKDMGTTHYPGESQDTTDEAPTDKYDTLADLRDDVMFRTVEALGIEGLEADDVADTLRRVADRVEDRA